MKIIKMSGLVPFVRTIEPNEQAAIRSIGQELVGIYQVSPYNWDGTGVLFLELRDGAVDQNAAQLCGVLTRIHNGILPFQEGAELRFTEGDSFWRLHMTKGVWKREKGRIVWESETDDTGIRTMQMQKGA